MAVLVIAIRRFVLVRQISMYVCVCVCFYACFGMFLYQTAFVAARVFIRPIRV